MAEVSSAKLAAGSIQLKSVLFESELSKKKLELKTVVYELNVYESLNKAFVTADLVISDALSLTSVMPIYGNETITIEFKTPDPAVVKSVKMKFRVVRIQEYQATNLRTSQYIIFLTSQEYFADLGTKISKAFVNMTISDMVKNIGTYYLRIDKSKFFETRATETPRTIVIPNMTPTKAIQFLCREAKSPSFNTSNYIFFENCDGFHFRPLDELILAPYPSEKNPLRPNIIDPDGNPETGGSDSQHNGDPSTNPASIVLDAYYATDKDFKKEGADSGAWRGGTISNKPFEMQKMNTFSFLTLFNNDHTLGNGGFENHYMYLNPAYSLFEDRTYDYFKNFTDMQHTSSREQGRLLTEDNPVIAKTGDAFQIFAMTNKGEADTAFLDQKTDFLHLKYGSLGLLENTVVNVDIPGDSERRAGDIVRLQFPEYGATDDIRGKINTFVSGDYLVVAVRHLYNSATGYKCIMQCVKNCYEKSLEGLRKANLPSTNTNPSGGTIPPQTGGNGTIGAI
jgi:hypothetical protein